MFARNFVFLVFIFSTFHLAHAVADREIAAKEAALAWLPLIDEEKYAEALEITAPQFREEMKKEDWVSGLGQVRQPLGSVDKRILQRLFATPVLPGGPEGDYVIVNFRTSFVGREEAVDEIVVMSASQDADGSDLWQVVGYYIDQK
ncbi:DUF4019 domain-containing protein [Rubellicoccus peritrichatus]|uniref:DUF4019 domain-containing protein n=1 Tax=Rubellicoccus peritrichatus TaxID=3080537 RepID=A0AAQ3QV84_9BACT|nr:DUF4019 domain-containing protein [Puniceicoccus sp. CR14]WOO41283.1 DUF4019 domain-containing protein [Puniceicoccus sp. CR14]